MIFNVKFQTTDGEMTAIVFHEPPEPETGFLGGTYIEGIEEADPAEEVSLMMEYEDAIWEEVGKMLLKMKHGNSSC